MELTLNETVEVTFGKTGDSATAGGVDYDSTTQTVTLGKPFSTNTVDDYLADNGEKYSVQITDKTLSNASKYETVVIDTTSVTTTILDNSKDTPNDPYDQTTTPPVEGDLDTITIKLFALDKDGNRVPANEVAEGSPASYVAVAFDKNGVELTLNETVEVTFGKTGDSATAGGVDYDSTTQTVTLGKPFSTNTVDDYLADNGEKYSVQITDKTLSNASKYETVVIDTTSVTTTILDNTTNKPNDPSTIEKDQENVILKIVAADKDGNPIKDANGDYLTQNEVPEGDNAYYVVLAFEPNTTKFNDNTKLDVQSGTVEVKTFDKNATGIMTQTKEDGTQDYISKTEKFELGKVISVETLDDWKADNGEQYEIKITDKSYEHPTTGAVYENVVTDKNPVTTTIKDNTTDKPNDPSTTETNGMENVILKIVAVGENGEPIIKDGKYTFANEVAEGSNAKYMVLAFKPDTTEFKVTDKLDVQAGKVTIKTTDDTAKTTGTKDNAELDYKSETAKEVDVGTVFEIETLDDYLADDGEKYTVSINDKSYTHPTTGAVYENVVTDKDPVTTTIKDNTTPGTEVDSEDVKIVLVAVTSATTTIADITNPDGTLKITNTNETPEGGKLYYIAVAVDKDDKPLSTQGGDVTIKYGTTSNTSDKDATEGTDYDNTTKVNTKVGVVFEVATKDDYYAEGDENFTVKITDLKNSPYETSVINTTKDTVTSTIKDNAPSQNQIVVPGGEDIGGNTYGQEDTVYAVITADKSSVVEGNKVTYTVKLVAGDGTTPVTVSSDTNVTIKFEGIGTNVASLDDLLKFFGSNGTTEIIGFDNTNQELTISIPKGSSSTQFTIQTKDDFTQEGSETFDLSISKIDSIEFENLVFDKTKAGADNKVTTEIKDGVTLGDPVNTKVYEDGLNNSATTENSLSNSLGITNPNNDEYKVSFDKSITISTEKSNGQTITYSYNESGTVLTAKRTDGKTVFTVELKKDASGKDVYDFQLKEAMDHEYGNNGKNDFDLSFKFSVTSNGTSSDYKTFNVTVVDSVPVAQPITVTTNEDTATTIRLSNDAFKDNGTIKINGSDVAKDNSIAIYEKGDTTKQIGTLKNNGDGTVKFTPSPDYSNYDFTKSPQFTYTVTDFDGDEATATVTVNVKPVADAPTIFVKNIETKEDAGNTQEGTNKVALELKVPSLSKDSDATSQTSPTGYTAKQNNNVTKTNPILDGTGDYNGTSTGDSPERNGEITLTFTNGSAVTGAKIFNGSTEVATINSVNQIVKVVIVKTSGGTDVDTDYHHNGTLPAKSGNVLYLTKSEYESLKIQHSEDNDTDIKITINVTSYEVDDSGKPLTGNLATLSTTTANMEVVIKPVTDDIELEFDTNTVNGEVLGTISDDKKTFTYKNIDESNKAIDLQALLSKTSGALNGIGGTKGDLDGSEKRTYIISDIPAGTVIILDGNSYTVQDEKTSIEIPFTSNTKADPTFTMKFPENYSGTVNAKITLSVIDKGVEANQADQTDYGFKDANGKPLLGVKQAEVNFKVNVNPVADDATIKVGQPEGYEDAGRSLGNTSNGSDASKIDKPENGIKLPITVTSTDTDGSETFTVTIKDIPNGSGLYVYDKSSASYKLVEVSNDGTITIDGQAVTGDKSGNISVKEENGKFAVEIKDYQNTEQPKFIPPHNEHGDFKLNVDAKTVDTVIIDGQPVTNVQDVATNKDILVVVKDVADSVVGNDYNKENLSLADGTNKDYNLITQEDTQIKLDSVFKDSTKLSSYDKESEDLTIILKSLPKGVELEGNVTLINGQYIFKASDIPSIKIVTPANYSGELNFDITYITTEKGEANNPSKTHDSKQETDKISIFVKPTIDAQFDSQTTKAEDSEIVDGGNSYYKVDLGISHQNGDNDETLESVTIKAPEANSGYKLFIIDGNTKTEITSDYTLKTTELNKVYVEVKENQHGSFDIKGTYTVKDSQYAGKDVNYETKETKDFTHKLTITPVTDTPTIEVETGTQTHINVNAGENTEIKIPVKVSSEDTDGSENITKIVISGVPKGVIIDTGSAELDAKITVSEHNGIYTITGHNLNSSNFKDIVFKVDGNANFEYRDITITAYTKDAQGSIEEQTSTKITLDKTHNGNGGGTGTGPKLEIIVDEVKKDFNATEDIQFNFLDVFKVAVADNSNDGRTELNFKIDVGSNATLKGLDAYKNADGSYTIKGNRADIESVLANLKVVPNKDFNSNQDGDGISIKVETNGKESTIKVPVTPVTDSLNVEITANDSTTIDENGEFNFDIKLTNNSDKEFTKINDFYVVVNENFEAGESSKGKLYLGNDEPKLVDGKYKLPADYKLGDSLNLTYKSGEDRHGAVEIKVIALNKETGAANELTSTGTTTITVKPVASSEIKVDNVQNGVEDKEMASAKLNVVKADPSEKFESVLIKVASGVAIYYNEGKSLAMNLGDGSWLVPVNSDGTLPQIFFKGNEHFGGEIKFDAIINVKDGNSKSTIELKDSSVYIKEVADGVTIDPTKTGIDAKGFEWTSLNLNANMKDVDGSEKMHFTLEGLDSSAQFRIVDKDGNITDLSSQSKFENGKWTINGIEYEDINNIQITHDKSVKDIKVEAWTQDGEDADISNKVEGKFDLNFTQDALKDGTLTLGKEMNIDFSKIESGDIKDVSTIDLGAQGENKLLNLTLQDVMDIGKKDLSGNINLTILGDEKDGVSFAKNDGWKKSETTITENNKTFDVYTNDGNSTVQVKVEQPISDGITN
ncbi:Ig-like domain-containing protein [Aliarcobacter butzleri]|uniref:Ig-like domain-containing protein n=1 Tax=Aliarcobacter butzleri TaxID=28197 RepID=UPI0021B3328B|nr:Ig-like domain-containing protein [Aliarcobacter butzleri]MCT7610035.1 Ig-like domain-containing protein [Aliarcobacter butzleri]